MQFKFSSTVFKLLFCFTSIANANNFWHSSDWKQNFVFSIAGGPAWTNSNVAESINNFDNNINNRQNQNNSIGVAELFIGTYKELTETLQAQFGAEIAWSGKAVVNGQILQNQNSDLFQANYTYNISQFRGSAKAKVIMEDFPVLSIVQPFIAGSVGVGLNRSDNFSGNVLNTATNNYLFSDKTVNAFTYTIGGGLQFPFNPFYQLGIGYEFSSWGKSQPELTITQNVNKQLDVVKINTNAIIFSLTYTA